MAYGLTSTFVTVYRRFCRSKHLRYARALEPGAVALMYIYVLLHYVSAL